jgi:hypothetical protein
LLDIATIKASRRGRVIAGRKLFGDGRGSVGRSVIDHHQLERRERLPQHALDGLSQKCFAIPNGEKNGDPGSLKQVAQYKGRMTNRRAREWTPIRRNGGGGWAY